MLTGPTGKQQSCIPQPKQVFGVGQRELEGTWRKHLGRRSGSLSRSELVLQEALARQMEVLHHLSQILIINRQGCTSLPRKVIMQKTKLSSIV
jgi:hypothetical protein